MKESLRPVIGISILLTALIPWVYSIYLDTQKEEAKFWAEYVTLSSECQTYIENKTSEICNYLLEDMDWDQH